MTDRDDVLADLRIGHSETQLDWFVLAGHGVTVWGAYQQALREIRARRDATAAAVAEIERLTGRYDAAKARAGRWWARGRAAARIKAFEAARALEALRAAQADRERELRHFESRAAELRARLIKGGPLTPDRVRRLDEDHWYAVVRRRVGLEIAANDRVEGSTLALLAGMPVHMRQRLAAALAPGMRGALVSEALTAAGPLTALPEDSPC